MLDSAINRRIEGTSEGQLGTLLILINGHLVEAIDYRVARKIDFRGLVVKNPSMNVVCKQGKIFMQLKPLIFYSLYISGSSSTKAKNVIRLASSRRGIAKELNFIALH